MLGGLTGFAFAVATATVTSDRIAVARTKSFDNNWACPRILYYARFYVATSVMPLRDFRSMTSS